MYAILVGSITVIIIIILARIFNKSITEEVLKEHGNSLQTYIFILFPIINAVIGYFICNSITNAILELNPNKLQLDLLTAINIVCLSLSILFIVCDVLFIRKLLIFLVNSNSEESK